MKTGYRGAFVISWSQTELDGLKAAPIHSMTVGAVWAWSGEIVRVDGPNGVLRLEQANKSATRRKCAAKLVRRLISAAQANTTHLAELDDAEEAAAGLAETSFVVTDGLKTYAITVVPVGGGAPPLLMFVDDIPPRNCELWVVHHSLKSLEQNATSPDSGGVICFTPGTVI